MRYASQDLMDEHEGILHGLSILEKMTARLPSGGDGLRGDLAAMVDFLRLFADKCHHGKEEGLMFPAMEKYGIPKDRGPIGQMLVEHEQGRKFISGMAKAIEGDAVDAAAFETNANGYTELLRAHIEKENTVLFPMGDRAIPQGEQDRLLRDFERHEETVMGAGVHERLDEFAKRYA